ncbi:ATP-binding protein [Streptomyces sp. NPDC006529]|uniref:ATP-binding protein n=1 Tax=Streptomyces sp. NPDC006529 TaxID=3157177 RepID=UPI0033A8838E
MAVKERAVRKTGPQAPADAADARALVAALLDAGPGASVPAVSGATLADALLVTSELVTNAFRHGGGLAGFEAEIDPDADALELTVTDRSSELPHTVPGRALLGGGPPAGPVEGGFGWPLIRLLADRVSVAPLPAGGKRIRVWLRLHGRA